MEQSKLSLYSAVHILYCPYTQQTGRLLVTPDMLFGRKLWIPGLGLQVFTLHNVICTFAHIDNGFTTLPSDPGNTYRSLCTWNH